MTATFDIDSIEIADTSFLHLKNPGTEEPIFAGSSDDQKPVGIDFHAPGSDAYEAASTKRTNRSLHRSKRKIDLTADLLRSDTIEFLADVTAGFRNLGSSSAAGATGRDLFKAVYADRKKGWIVEQANLHLADWGNALKGSATT